MSPSRVGIVGGGLLGLATGYRLACQGVQVEVLERGDALGGLMASFDFDGHRTDRFYHVVLPTDDRVRGLAGELGLGDAFRFRPTGVGFWNGGRLLSISSTREFLTFPLLSPVQRMRLAAFVLRCNRRKQHADLDDLPLLPWLERQCGKGVVERLWRPLLDSKFDGRYHDLPATYMWARTRRMSGTRDNAGREVMGTLEGGYQVLIEALANGIRARGGSVETGVPVSAIEPVGGGAGLLAGSEPRRYDLVLSTLLPAQGRRILGPEYAGLAPPDHCRYLGVICLLLRTRRSVSPYYTLSLTDRSVALTTVVETTHVVSPEAAGGHLLYVTKYVDPSSGLLDADTADVEAAFMAQARRVLPGLDDAGILATSLQRARAVEPVHLVGGAQRLPTMFPAPGLALASSAHVYPEVVNGQAVLGVAEQAAAGILARLAPQREGQRHLSVVESR